MNQDMSTLQCIDEESKYHKNVPLFLNNTNTILNYHSTQNDIKVSADKAQESVDQLKPIETSTADPDEMYYDRIPKIQFQQMMRDQSEWLTNIPDENASPADICLFISNLFSKGNSLSNPLSISIRSDVDIIVSAVFSSEEIFASTHKPISVTCSGNLKTVESHLAKYPWFHKLCFLSYTKESKFKSFNDYSPKKV
ncbi:MAG: hypothetical protein Sylvanvirus4_27 [Sylvanvirus sp.]|uniref:Uncharacterized protein n=1 Tax=Sylvanvirus sp. TaxID=2487774 RepID=A0A3G5AKA0_9VIRU|nr:MAG: hypothetical protein Sylvanvirus4_27 [Sylvanvirus sp.]